MEPPSGGGPPPAAGLLTAGTWDDNRNFDFFLKYYGKLADGQSAGIVQAPVADRLVITVTDEAGAPMAGARVTVTSAGRSLAQSETGAEGRVLFFPSWAGLANAAPLDVVAEVGGVRKQVTAKAGDDLVTLPLAAPATRVTGLDAAIVIDTTGSMGDEMSYLAAELLNVSNAIKERHPELSQRWAFVAYKDDPDEYVTKKHDFVSDVAAFKHTFAQLRAGGGGDYEEAPERGLADMNTLEWRSGAVARVAFWVGDAPHHNGRAAEVLKGLRGAQDRGVHVYPVSASGTDDRLELAMRLGALITGGRYIFLTDDSGIGGVHKEPKIPCYRVTTLQKAMLRMLSIELDGKPVEPAPADVIRTSGNPSDGRCTLPDGEEVEML